MSDQVVFTKEEVEKIREFVSVWHTAGIKADYIDVRNAKYIKELLDSPRPRPKVPMHLLSEIAIACVHYEKNRVNPWNQDDLRRIANRLGFDVED